MRRLLFTTAAMLVGCTGCLAQVATMGSTAMGISSRPGAIVTSPLTGPGPFSATTQPGTPVTTLAPVPLASDPTTPGTVVTCSTPSGQITPGTAAVPVTSLSAVGGAAGTPASAAPTMPAVTASTSATTAPLLLSAQPATSFMSDFPGSTVPVTSSPISAPPPSTTPAPVPTPSALPNPGSPSKAGNPPPRTPPTRTLALPPTIAATPFA